MKIYKNLTCVLLLSLVLANSSISYAAGKTIKITVKESQILHTIGGDMYGVARDVGLDEPHLTNNNRPGINMKLVEDLKAEGFSMRFFRLGGAGSNKNSWKSALGYDYFARPRVGTQRRSFSSIEMLQLVNAFDSESGRICYNVGLFNESPQEIADLAEFMLGDGKINYNGGVNWAQKRIELGVREPARVKIWELGNEINGSASIHPYINYELYIQKCKEVMAAIRSVDEDAEFAVCMPMGHAAPGRDDSELVFEIIAQLGDQIKYIVDHPYFDTNSPHVVDKYMDTVIRGIRHIDPEDKQKIKIACTEYYCWDTFVPEEAGYSDKLAGGLYFAGGRATADVLLRMLKSGMVGVATIWETKFGHEFSFAYPDRDGKYKLNATGMVLSMFQNYGVGDYVKFELPEFKHGEASEIAAGIIKTPEGLNLILVNNNDDMDLNLEFDFEDKYFLKERQFITPKVKGRDAVNYVGVNEINRVNEKFEDNSEFTHYTLPKMTITALKLQLR